MWFEIYLDNEWKWRWRLFKRDLNNQVFIIATSHQGHRDKTMCEREIVNVKATSFATPIYYK